MSPSGGSEVPLVLGFLAWLTTGWWMGARGWRVQRRRLVAAGQEPLGRWMLIWWDLLLGAVVLVLTHTVAGSPGVVAVAMAGLPAMVVDARIHRLPDAYTLAMALGTVLGLVSVVLVAERPYALVARDLVVGAVAWAAPLALARTARAGVGLGDVKLAPVLGALTGLVSWEAALGGLVLAFLGAGAGALWTLVTRSGNLRTRIPMGPWMIGGALAAVVVAGVGPSPW